jgi:hypothetical protein
MAAAWMSKMYPTKNEDDGVDSLQNLCIENLTEAQKSYLVSECYEQYPFICDKIMKETRMDFDRVVFDIQWMRNAIRRNTVSGLKEKCPAIFDR